MSGVLDHGKRWLRVLRVSWWFLPLIHWVLPNLVPLPRRFKWRSPRSVQLIGHGTLAAGSGLTMWAIWTLVLHGDGTPNPATPPQLFVQHGPYRFCRNPMEQGNALQLLGRSLVAGCPRLGLGCTIFWLLTHWWVVRHEEPQLVQRFGDRYTAYQQAVPRWGWRW